MKQKNNCQFFFIRVTSAKGQEYYQVVTILIIIVRSLITAATVDTFLLMGIIILASVYLKATLATVITAIIITTKITYLISSLSWMI